eukprot:874187-Rhodomonas_salina.2
MGRPAPHTSATQSSNSKCDLLPVLLLRLFAPTAVLRRPALPRAVLGAEIAEIAISQRLISEIAVTVADLGRTLLHVHARPVVHAH